MAKSLVLKVRVAAAAAFVVGSALFQPIDVHAAGGELQAKIDKGGTVSLTADDTESIIIKKGTTATLNLNGHKLANDAGKSTITVEKGGTLTVNGDGEVISTAAGKAAVTNYGTVTINKGKYTRTGEYYTLINRGKLMTITDATVTNSGTYTKGSLVENGYCSYDDEYKKDLNDANPTLVINSGDFSYGNASVKNDDGGITTINGGKFHSGLAAVQNANIATINGGEFDSNGLGKEKYLINNAGYAPTEIHDKGKLTVNGGIFHQGSNKAIIGGGAEDEPDDVTITYGTFDGILMTEGEENYAKLSISGGKFTDNEQNNKLVSAYKVEGLDKVKLADGTIVLGGTVKLEGDGGKGTDLTSYEGGKATTLPTDWTKDGYTFAGWYENADFSGKPVTKIAADAKGAKTYYAKWDKVEAKTDNSKTTKKDKSVTKAKIVAPGVTAPRKASISAPNTGVSRLAAFFDAIVAFFTNLF